MVANNTCNDNGEEGIGFWDPDPDTTSGELLSRIGLFLFVTGLLSVLVLYVNKRTKSV
jgi:hypothetical protein